MNETVIRTLSGIVYIAVLVAATYFSFLTFVLLFGVFLLIGVVEFCRLVDLKPILPLTLAIAAYALLALFGWGTATTWGVLAATLFISVKCLALLFSRHPKIDRTERYLYLIGYLILPMILITKIPMATGAFHPLTMIGIFVLIWANDTFAFVVGKTMGKHKLFERISPKKTVEGFAGGLIFALAFALVIAKYVIFEPVWLWLSVSLIVSIFGTLGDLVESRFKRLAGVKDSGRIMPGHGGILDRLDSLLFVAPILFLLYQIVNHVP